MGDRESDDDHIAIQESNSMHADDDHFGTIGFIGTDATYGCAEEDDACITTALISRDNSPANMSDPEEHEALERNEESEHHPIDMHEAEAAARPPTPPMVQSASVAATDHPLAAPPSAATGVAVRPLTGMAAFKAGRRASYSERQNSKPTGSSTVDRNSTGNQEGLRSPKLPNATPSPATATPPSTIQAGLNLSPGNGVSFPSPLVDPKAADHPWLLNGEKMTVVLSDAAVAHWLYSGSKQEPHIPGTFYMTTYRVKFVPDDSHVQRILLRYPSALSYLEVPLACIDKVEMGNPRKPVMDAKGGGLGLELFLHCKDVRIVKFMLIARAGRPGSQGKDDPTPASTRLTVDEIDKGAKAVSVYAFAPNIKHVFAFSHRPADSEQAESSDTASPDSSPLDPMQEWLRMGISRGNTLVSGNAEAMEKTEDDGVSNQWRISSCNAKYDLCKSYPKNLVVPMSMSDLELKQVAAFRSGQRLMALSWRDKRTNVTIWRSSQPKAGISGSNIRDEKYLDLIAKSVNFYRASILHIIDCRPKTAALANRAGGAGYESKSNYPSSRLEFYNIGNIHTMRDSFTKMSNLHVTGISSDARCADWGRLVEDTGWPGHVRMVIKAAMDCAKQVSHGVPVLVHCSHGWDRTSQVCALAGLLLDPYYRTFRGFQVLIEKEWCAFGHPFQLRCAHGEDKSRRNDEQMSPIFVQFLECCYHFCSQYPLLFEFTPRYLLTIANHVHSCRFSTFLLSCDHDREMLQTDRKCTSIWKYLAANYSALRNPFFREENTGGLADPKQPPPPDRCPHLLSNGTLLPPLSCVLNKVHIWTDFWERWSGSELQQVAPQRFYESLVVLGSQQGDASGLGPTMAPVIMGDIGEDKGNPLAYEAVAQSGSDMHAADRVLDPMVTSTDFWEAAFRRERAARLALEAELGKTRSHLAMAHLKGSAEDHSPTTSAEILTPGDP